MQEYFAVLFRSPLFAGIDAADVPGLLVCLQVKAVAYKKGQTVFAEGDPSGMVGIVLSGGVQVAKEDYYGNRSILAQMEPGDMFGESFACAGVAELPVSVSAVEDTRVLLIDCQRITTSCSNACGFHNQMIRNLLRIVAQNNLRMNQKLEILQQRTTREKLMTYLLMHAKRQGSSRFTIPFDRQALADYLGVERSAMSAEISKLRAEGVLESEKNRFALLREI